jgi:hypothetical protein
MSDALIDFSRYAPRRDASQAQETGELAQALHIIGNCLTIIGQCLAIAGSVIVHRARTWFFEIFLQSLRASWTAAGIGWGGFVGLFLMHFI